MDGMFERRLTEAGGAVALLVFAAALVLLLTSCGGVRVVTRVVHVRPCATAPAMTSCVTLLVGKDLPGTKVRVSCDGSSRGRFWCVVATDNPVSGARCTRLRVDLAGPGIPYPAVARDLSQAVCDAKFGRA